LPEPIRVAALQMTSGSDRAANVERAIELVEAGADEGATYLQLPEHFNYLGPVERYREVAETVPGPTTDRFGDYARKRHVVVHLGSMLEVGDAPGKFFNTSVVLGTSGEVVAAYRKAHLFDIDVPGAVTYRESDTIIPGDDLVVVTCPGFDLGLSVCFDLRFPELYRALALAGASVLAIPSAFRAATGRAHWEVLVRARAIENHAFVIAAAQAGTTAEGIASFGHSLVVGPWGEVVAESSGDGEDVLVTSLDMDQVARRRSQIDVLHLRRPDLYRTPEPWDPGAPASTTSSPHSLDR